MSQIINTTKNTSHAVTPFQLFIRLSSGQFLPGKCWQKTSFRRKFFIRLLLMPRVTSQLLTQLTRWPELNTLLTRQPRLPIRLHRPYMAVKMKRSIALNALCSHYKILGDLFTHEQQISYLSEKGLCLAKFEAKDGAQFQLDLVSMVSLDKEGESTIAIRDSQMRILAEITFTYCQLNNKSTLFIGGLQGAASDLPHEIIRKATKDCYGLFPKRVVIEAICQFAQFLNVEQILAVGNEAHVYRCWRYMDKKTQMHADYDEFWSSLGGNKISGNYFTLPLAIARKSEADIASKKRAEYRRRYQLLDSIHSQLSLMFRH